MSSGSRGFRTTLFSILDQSTGGTATTWAASSPTSNSSPSPSNSMPEGNPAADSSTSSTMPSSTSSTTSSSASGTASPSAGAAATTAAVGNDSASNQYMTSKGVSCLSASDLFYAECWTVLGIDSWLPKWYRDTPVCPPGHNDTACRIADPGAAPEAWAQTLLREAEGTAPGDCTSLGSTPGAQPCVYTGNAINNAIPGAAPTSLDKARFSWLAAINFANQQAIDPLDAIIKKFDPERKTHVKLNYAFTALGLGLGLIPVLGPEFALLGNTALTVANLAVKGIKNAPAVASYIWPVGTASSQDVQFAKATDLIETLEKSLATSFGAGLTLLLNDSISDFLLFTSNGTFSQSQGSITVPTNSLGDAALRLAFTTFLVSTILAQNGWHIIMLPGVNPEGFTNGSQPCPSWAPDDCSKDTDLKKCNQGYDVYNQCNGNWWWYSATHNSAYTLNDNHDTDATDGINTILSNTWSTGQLLFENAAVCNMQNMLNQTVQDLNYTTLNGKAGFMYQGSIAELDPSDETPVNEATSFLPIGSGGGLSRLSRTARYSNALYHPTDADTGLFRFDADGLDLSCISQLNITIANDWGHWS
ncbi:MAG: hypothetical protein Q9218_006651 [Villophora microphyllina]